HRDRRPDPGARGRAGGRPRHARRAAGVVPDLRRDRRVPGARRGGRVTTATPAHPPPARGGEPGGPEPRPPGPGGPGTVRPMGGLGVPVERSRDFAGAARRLLSMLREDRVGVAAVVALAVAGVVLLVLGPRVLGHATDIVVRGVLSPSGIDVADLRNVLLGALALYLASSGLSYLSAWLLAGIVQRTMHRLRSDVEDKLHRLPLGYIDRQ